MFKRTCNLEVTVYEAIVEYCNKKGGISVDRFIRNVLKEKAKRRYFDFEDYEE
jgi:hypothetical protein